jgi:PAS domain S-box-containing protein
LKLPNRDPDVTRRQWRRWIRLTLSVLVVVAVAVASVRSVSLRQLESKASERTIWSEHKAYVVAAVVIIAAEFGLIAGLLSERRWRHTAEIALRRTEARNSALLRTIPDLMFVMTPDGVYLDYNANHQSELLVPPDQFLGKNMRDVLPADLANAFEPLLRQAMNADAPLSHEYTLTLGGTERHFEARLMRCDNDTLISIIRDITANRKAAEQLHQTQLELAQATRVRSLGELATGIAHEVSQPLAAMITNARAGLRRLEGSCPPEELRGVLNDIVSDGKRATDVITRVRGLVKQAPMRPTALDVNDVVDDVIALSRPMLRERSVRLEIQRVPDLPRVTGDRIQLQQVLLNLVINAADAMRAVSAHARVLEIRTARDNRHISVLVHDSGPGLTEASVRRIFTPFFTTKPDGMGVGLAISRSIVEAHGGHLNLKSNSGDGATFELELPVA